MSKTLTKYKDFESSNREEIEAELLRLMRDPKCYYSKRELPIIVGRFA